MYTITCGNGSKSLVAGEVLTLSRMLNRAGLELRLEPVERDDHDEVLAEWEWTLDDAGRQRLRSQGYRLVSDAA